jgi:hypothetical protein
MGINWPVLLGVLAIGFLLIGGIIILFPGPKGAGGICKTNSDCISFSCSSIGFCNASKEAGYCRSSSDCDNGLVCQKNSCTKPNAFCRFKDPIFWGGLIIFFIGFFCIIRFSDCGSS